jgi:Cof subfamily protein (haloacid dehalogenase superfamily)
MYKLVAIDIDGTLLNHEKAISERTKQIIESISTNIKIILISSRMPKAMRYLQQELKVLDMPLVAYNGGLVVAGEKIISSIGIDFQAFRSILDFNQELELHLSLYHNDEWYAPQTDYWTEREERNTQSKAVLKDNEFVFEKWKKEGKLPHKIMCMGEEQKVEKFYNLLDTHLGHRIHLYRSKSTYIEISPINTDKLNGLKVLIDNIFTEIRLDNVVAYGDNYNDVEMIQNVGLGVAVENAKSEVKAVANHITASNKNEGVAMHLEKLFQ